MSKPRHLTLNYIKPKDLPTSYITYYPTSHSGICVSNPTRRESRGHASFHLLSGGTAQMQFTAMALRTVLFIQLVLNI